MGEETLREARCQCGQLHLQTRGEPSRVSVCHCLDCQRRSGSVFATQARFPETQVTLHGEAKTWSRRGDEGGGATFGLCPQCGSTVYYRNLDMPDAIAIPVGAFADPAFPPPSYSVYEERQHAWVRITGDMAHYD